MTTGRLISGTSFCLFPVVNRETDWRKLTDDVVRGTTRTLAKKFPYRGEFTAA